MVLSANLTRQAPCPSSSHSRRSKTLIPTFERHGSYPRLVVGVRWSSSSPYPKEGGGALEFVDQIHSCDGLPSILLRTRTTRTEQQGLKAF